MLGSCPTLHEDLNETNASDNSTANFQQYVLGSPPLDSVPLSMYAGRLDDSTSLLRNVGAIELVNDYSRLPV
jgi:hypothetical protein